MNNEIHVNLKEFVERIFDEREKQINQIFDEREKLYELRDSANKESVRAAFVAAEKAGEKLEIALKEYKAGANEWKDTVKDIISNMVNRKDLEVLEDKIVEVKDRLNKLESKTEGKKEVKDVSRANLVIIISTILSIAAIVIAYIK